MVYSKPRTDAERPLVMQLCLASTDPFYSPLIASLALKPSRSVTARLAFLQNDPLKAD